MRFLSDILAKAGLIVDGAVVFNSTANGQTPTSNDNSTKLATTAWVRSFVQPYTLPIASATTLGGVKVGTGLAIDSNTGVLSLSGSGISIKSTETFTATQGQTVFTITNGYTVGLIDVFLNGVYLSPGQITATNGTTITLLDSAIAGDIIDVIVTSPLSQGSIATTDQVAEGLTNLYYTNLRARASISLTTSGVSGAATYNQLTGALNIPNYQGLVPANGLAGQILAKASGTSYDTTWIDNYTSQIKHQVKLGEAMSAGTAVYVPITQDSGTVMTVMKASNAAESTSSKTMGIIATGGVAGDFVYVFTEGLLSGLNTASASKGDPIWLGTNGTLIFGLANKPSAPAHLVFLGIVTRSQQNNGEIFVKVQNGFELDELHDLSVKNASDGDMIKYVASTGLWTKIAATTTNITEGTNLYYTDSRVNSYLTTNNYATQLYVNTAIANLIASAPTTLDTLNELATALGNDPNFATTVTTSLGTKVPQSRTITINGTAYDLSADRSWSIAGGVTSFNTRTGAIILASSDVTTALGFTPYNATNPNGYITSSALSSYLPLSGGTLTGALSGTSATFSSDLIALSTTLNGSTHAYLNLNAANAGGNEAGIYFKIGGTAKWEQYTAANDGNLSIWSNGNGIRFYITPTAGAVFAANVSASNFRVYNGSTTGGYLIPKAGWVGSGTDYSPSIAAETTYGINFFTNGSASVKMYLATTGQLQLNTYTSSTSYSGTAAGYLAFDSSGNIITVASVAATDNTKLPLAGGTMTGTPVFTSSYSGTSTDYTGISNPSYKIAPTSGYWRAVYLSNNATVSGVYNYETGKNVYWGEPTDTGGYYFRGRSLYYTESNGTDRAVLHAGNYTSYAMAGAGYSANQNLNTSSGPTFADVYNNGWFRNNNAGQGLYNQAVSNHFYASTNNDWNIGATGSYPKLWLRDGYGGTSKLALYSDSTSSGILNSSSYWGIRFKYGTGYQGGTDLFGPIGFRSGLDDNGEVAGGMKMITHSVNKVGSSKFIKINAGTNNYFTGFIFGMNFDNYPPNSTTNTGAGFAYQFGGWSDGNGACGDKYFDLQWFGGNNVGNLGREMNTDGNGYIITTPTSTGAGGYKVSATIMLFARDMSKITITYY